MKQKKCQSFLEKSKSSITGIRKFSNSEAYLNMCDRVFYIYRFIRRMSYTLFSIICTLDRLIWKHLYDVTSNKNTKRFINIYQ